MEWQANKALFNLKLTWGAIAFVSCCAAGAGSSTIISSSIVTSITGFFSGKDFFNLFALGNSGVQALSLEVIVPPT